MTAVELIMLQLLVLTICLLCGPACAQAVYKCSIDGKVAYGDRPCGSGSSAELRVPQAPAPDPVAALTLKREQAKLASLQKQRYAREAREERARARFDRAAAAHSHQCAKLRMRTRWADEDLSREAGNRKEALRTKARRQHDVLALECPS